MANVVNAITTFIGGDTFMTVLKVLGLLLGGFFIFWFKNWAEKKKLEQTKEQQEQEKVKDKQDMVEDNEKEDQKLKDDSSKVDDFLNK